MDIKLLKTFAAVVRYNSVTRVAEELGLSQPAVSIQIARLEEQVGFELFSRINGRLRPTSAGLVFYAEVNKALGSIEHLAQSARDIRAGQLGTVTVAGHPSASISLLPDIVARFTRDRPGVVVRMLSRHSQVLRQIMPVQSFDVGIAELPLDEKAVHLRRFRMRCVAVLPTGDSLARHAVLTPELLSHQPFVGASGSQQVNFRIRQVFEEAKADLSVVADTEMFASSCGLVAGGLGCAIVDPLSARTFHGLGLEIRQFDPPIFYDIGVFHSLQREPSVLAAAFLDVLYAALEPFKTA
jgi:DNA-binding transcriptional LysR family regulator